MKIALLGNITLDFFAQDFRRMGHETYVPPGFDTWRQETLDPESGLHRFAPDATLLLLPNEDIFKVVTDLSSLEDPTSLASLAPSLTLSTLAHETPGFWDDRMRRLAAMPFSLAGLKAIEEEFLFLAEFAAAPKKILAVDADNTLWRGIVSEDDPATVVPYADFQRGLLALKDAGALLVLLSKNDSPANSDAPVARAFARSDMPLSLDDFAAVAVNWSTKASNMLDVCSRLNLSPDSAVFIDDNPHERAQMKAHLPAVTVMPFPRDMTRPAAILRRLRTRFFASVASTDEDRVRTALYQAEAARQGVDREAFEHDLRGVARDAVRHPAPRPDGGKDQPVQRHHYPPHGRRDCGHRRRSQTPHMDVQAVGQLRRDGTRLLHHLRLRHTPHHGLRDELPSDGTHARALRAQPCAPRARGRGNPPRRHRLRANGEERAVPGVPRFDRLVGGSPNARGSLG